MDVAVVAQLDDVAQRLTEELGFGVTLVQAIGFLVKRHRFDGDGDFSTAQAKQLPTAEGDRHMDEQVRTHMLKGEKILAIKLVRTMTAMSLKEAKDYVESRDWRNP